MAVPAAAVGVARMAGSAVGQVGIQLALEKAFFNKDVKDTTKATENAFSKSFSGIEKASGKKFSAIGGIIKTTFAVVGVGAVVNFTKTAVNAASETQAAWTGLNSIVTGTGKSFVEAKGFLEEYVSDGLIPLTDAITSYKNLAARGYSTEQIEQTMTALKDAAAFGRQASYSYGEAIKSATEGLKNENSILVDNAGVTKNVAKMWDDYAASIGTTANELTQQQKIQAEVNGILEETKFQVGDATAYANTFSGKIAKINTAFYNFRVAVGKFVAPIAELFLPYIEMALNALTRFFNKMAQVLKVFGLEMPDVVSKASTSIADIGSSASNASGNIASTGDAATKAAKKIKRAFAGVDEINVLNMPESSSGSKGSSGSSGTGSGAGSSSGAISDITEVGDVVESVDGTASKIANKIKELFAPLKEIDFTNLTNAFDRLKEAATPLTQKLFSGLEWLWFNVLVPFATWTIEDAIPAFFEALAGALDFLNGVMDYAKPYLQYLWEEFLQPIAKWTGGAIVKTFEAIGDGLSKVGKWLSENKPNIEGIRKELDPFTDLLKELVKTIGILLGFAWEGFTNTIKVLWEVALKPIWEKMLKPMLTTFWSGLKGLAEILTGIFEAFNKIMEGDWEGAGNAIVSGLKDGIKEIWEGSFVKKYLYDPIVGWWKKQDTNLEVGAENKTTKTKVGEWWTNIKKWWGSKNLSIGSTYTTTKTKVGEWWTTIKKWWSSKKLSIGSTNTTTKSQVSKWWTNIKSWWSSKKLSIGSTNTTTKSQVSNWWANIKSWWGSKTLDIKANVSNATGSVKNFTNDVIGKINSKLPDWLPKIPKLAQGGWLKANNPQLAIVGDNKHEPEIVSPESKIYEQTRKAVEDAGGTNTQQIEFVINVKYEDGKSIIKKINNTQIQDGKISLLV